MQFTHAVNSYRRAVPVSTRGKASFCPLGMAEEFAQEICQRQSLRVWDFTSPLRTRSQAGEADGVDLTVAEAAMSFPTPPQFSLPMRAVRFAKRGLPTNQDTASFGL